MLRDRAGKSEREASEDVIEGESAAATYSPTNARRSRNFRFKDVAGKAAAHTPAMHTDVMSFEPAFRSPTYLRLNSVWTFRRPTSRNLCLSSHQVNGKHRKSWLVFSLNPSLFRFVDRARPLPNIRSCQGQPY